MPSGVQERWFAKAWLAKPLILTTLCAFWLVSGLIGITVSRDAAVALTSNEGPGQSWMFAEHIADLLAADSANP